MGKRKSGKVEATGPATEQKPEKKHKKNKKSKSDKPEEGAKSGAFDSDLNNIFASAVASAPAPAPAPTAATAPKGEKTEAKGPQEKEAESSTSEVPAAEATDGTDDQEELDDEQLAAFREELGLKDDELPDAPSDKDSEAEAEADDTTPLPKKKQHKTKTAPMTHEQRERQNARTIFLGNVPLPALTSRQMQRQLRSHIVAVLPDLPKTAIQSIRFRSIPFSVPTADYTTGATTAAEAVALEKKNERSRLHRQQAAQSDLAEKGLNPHAVQFLRPSQKRKIAAIKQDLNTQASSCNCYVVVHPAVAAMAPEEAKDPVEPNDEQEEEAKSDDGDEEKDEGKGGALNAAEADLDPNASKRARIVAAVLASLLDGSLFAGKHLRADMAQPLSSDEVAQGKASIARAGEATHSGLIAHLAPILNAGLGSLSTSTEPKETIFVGNLDFAAADEDLRAFFEGLVTSERGPPRASKSWVKSVRIVRDRATQMGKGFGYVRFVDEASVDEVMAMWEADQARVAAAEAAYRKAGASVDGRARPTVKRNVKFMKRALRLARCKTLPGGPTNNRNKNQERGPRTPGTPTATPVRGRSSGAPTPGGTSPWTQRPRRTVDTSPSRSNHAEPLPEPGSKEALKLAKKDDPERKAKRVAKKEKKRYERSVVAATGSASGKISLKQGRRSKGSKPGQANKKPMGPKKPSRPQRPAPSQK